MVSGNLRRYRAVFTKTLLCVGIFIGSMIKGSNLLFDITNYLTANEIEFNWEEAE
jgi:hypothetical protein